MLVEVLYPSTSSFTLGPGCEVLVGELYPSTSSFNLGPGCEVLVGELHPSTCSLNLGTESVTGFTVSESISMRNT